MTSVFVTLSTAKLERSRYCPERNSETVPAVDCDNGQREIDEFLFCKMRPNGLVRLIRHVIDTDERDRFCPGQRGALSFRVVRALAPEAHGIQTLLSFPSDRATFVCMSTQYAQPFMKDARSFTSSSSGRSSVV